MRAGLGLQRYAQYIDSGRQELAICGAAVPEDALWSRGLVAEWEFGHLQAVEGEGAQFDGRCFGQAEQGIGDFHPLVDAVAIGGEHGGGKGQVLERVGPLSVGRQDAQAAGGDGRGGIAGLDGLRQALAIGGENLAAEGSGQEKELGAEDHADGCVVLSGHGPGQDDDQRVVLQLHAARFDRGEGLAHFQAFKDGAATGAEAQGVKTALDLICEASTNVVGEVGLLAQIYRAEAASGLHIVQARDLAQDPVGQERGLLDPQRVEAQIGVEVRAVQNEFELDMRAALQVERSIRFGDGRRPVGPVVGVVGDGGAHAGPIAGHVTLGRF